MSFSPNLVLCDFKVVRPLFEGTQSHGVDWIAAIHAQAEKQVRKDEKNFEIDEFQALMKKMILRFGCGPERIRKRGYELEDFNHFEWDKMRVFRIDDAPHGLGMDERLKVFSEGSRRVFEELYESVETAPSDVIHVTCTGYLSPSGAQEMVEQKEWHKQTKVTHAYHMGCYAAMPAVRMAVGFLSSHCAVKSTIPRVDIVHTEMCALHLNPLAHSPDQLVVQSLFSDGFIRYSLQMEQDLKIKSGLKFLVSHEEIIPKSKDAMTWQPTDWGMRMSLSKDVPSLVASALDSFLETLFELAGLHFSTEKEKCIFAIHPGGPKIIDKVQELLSLSEQQVKYSRHVLFEYGNMSSATIPHVWNEIVQDDFVEPETLIVSLAFGPGLSVCGNLLRKL
jgi:predicted naringenin-chalcone synthase